MSQAELARRLDVSRAAVSSWCNAETGPDLATLGRVAEALEVPVYRLFYDEDDERRHGKAPTKRDRMNQDENALRLIADRMGYDVVRLRHKKPPPH